MSNIENKVYNEDCLETMKRMPDKSINLIVADFPYFEIKGEFDFIWKDFNEFLEWVEVVAKEFKRVLADNGSLYVYGHAKKIAYKQIIFDKYFNIENHLVWEKADCQAKIGIEEFRSYAPVKEHILFYSNEVEETGQQIINNDQTLYKPIRDYFLEQRELIKHISYKDINTKCFGSASNGGGMASNILTSYKKGWSFPTKEMYENLQMLKICKKPYEDLRKEYEDLRKEYEDLRRPFNNTRFTDALKFSQEVHITKKYDHPTQKPPKLTKVLIETVTNKDSVVYIPFGGSGVEAEQCEILGRPYIVGDIEKKYCDMIKERTKKARGEVGLFAEAKDTKTDKGLFNE